MKQAAAWDKSGELAPVRAMVCAVTLHATSSQANLNEFTWTKNFHQ